MKHFGLYIHWPFCLSKCPYCDFNSHVRETVDQSRWKKALLTELASAGQKPPPGVLRSIFFGGGTPSLMDPQTVKEVIDQAKACFPYKKNLEITLEANPSTVEATRFQAFSQAGVTRLSLGVQSLEDEALSFLGRRHTAKEALRALDIAAIYFPRFSFDLIYGRPNQSLMSWKNELGKALSYAKGHLSLYQLTIEPQTVFARRLARGEKMSLDEELAASLYALTEDLMCHNGLPPYEVSNYAAPSQECVHNLMYWNVDDYIGLGPGAHGRLTEKGEKVATARYKVPEIWLKAVEKQGHGLQVFHHLSRLEKLQEFTLMNLRLTKGLNLNLLQEKTGIHLKEAYNQKDINLLEKEGLLKQKDSRLIPTFEGRLCLDGLITFLLRNSEVQD